MSKDLIYNRVYELTDNYDNALEIYDIVDEIEKNHINEIKKIKLDFNTHVNKLKQVVENLNDKITIRENRMRNERIFYKNLPIIRQYINLLFNKLWDNCKDNYNNIDFDRLANNATLLKRKNLINRENGQGVKYALLVLYDKIKDNIPKDICEFYIKLNDTFHPRITPKSIIKESIDELVNIISDVEDNIIIKNSGLNKQILDELMVLVDKE